MGRAEIAGLYGIPTMLLPGSDDKAATYASSETFNRQLVDYTLRDDLTMWQNELNSKLFANTDFYCEFDLRDLLRGDTAARAQYWKARWEVGSISANEIREDENENPIDGGDKYYFPLNYGVVGEPIPAVIQARISLLPRLIQQRTAVNRRASRRVIRSCFRTSSAK
jgi:phage portal protein BeeE